MAIIRCFDAPHLEAACKVLADTTMMGLKGDEIGYILKDMGVADPDPAMTKWKRLFNTLVLTQNNQVGNHLIMFINRAMNPVRYVNAQEQFNWRRDGLNVVHPGDARNNPSRGAL